MTSPSYCYQAFVLHYRAISSYHFPSLNYFLSTIEFRMDERHGLKVDLAR